MTERDKQTTEEDIRSQTTLEWLKYPELSTDALELRFVLGQMSLEEYKEARDKRDG